MGCVLYAFHDSSIVMSSKIEAWTTTREHQLHDMCRELRRSRFKYSVHDSAQQLARPNGFDVFAAAYAQGARVLQGSQRQLKIASLRRESKHESAEAYA